MSFPRYPAYKDSGVEWLGKVPVHWGVMSLVRDIEFITSGARGWAENYADDGDLFIRIGNLTRDSINLDLSDVQRVVVPPSAEVDRTQVQPGDVLFSITAYLGSVAVVPPDLGKAFVSQHVALVRPKQRHCISAWIGYVALSHVGKTHLETTGYGGTKVQLSLADVTTMPVLVPPKDEQSQLAAFLDRETAKIDALVAEQEQLITLLKEKRQAVISHAVTKGLDPSVPMKDSGVEWLGEMPAHWQVNRLQRVVKPGTSVTYGIVQAGPDFEDGIPYIRTSDMAGDALPRDGYPKTSPEIDASYARSKVSAGDLVIAIRATVGKCLSVPHELDGANLTQGTARIAPGPETDPGYLLAFINGNGAQTYFDRMAKGATFREITLEVLRKTPVLVPPLDEQCQIASWVTQQSDQFLKLIREAEHSQVLLKERRSALISAAVTGQIDVRGLAPAPAQTA